MSSSQKRRFDKPGEREHMSKTQKEKWADPKYKEKMKIVMNKESRTDSISKGVVEWIKTHPKEHQERMEKINKNPDKIKKTADAHRGMKRSAEAKENIKKSVQAYQENETEEDRLKRTGKGMKYGRNLETGKMKRFAKNEALPSGWVWGSLGQSSEIQKQKSEKLKGSYFAYNLESGIIRRFKKDESLPDGWAKGRN